MLNRKSSWGKRITTVPVKWPCGLILLRFHQISPGRDISISNQGGFTRGRYYWSQGREWGSYFPGSVETVWLRSKFPIRDDRVFRGYISWCQGCCMMLINRRQYFGKVPCKLGNTSLLWSLIQQFTWDRKSLTNHSYPNASGDFDPRRECSWRIMESQVLTLHCF